MEKHYQLSDEQFQLQFGNCSIDPVIFTHEAHLRLAWIHVGKYGIGQAITNLCSQIQNFAAYHGAKDKYNKTITIAAIRAVYHFMLKSNEGDFQSFINNNPRLKNNFKELLSTHYSTNIFGLAKTRTTYLEPDLEPFDPDQ
jgi:hypothetical protein